MTTPFSTVPAAYPGAQPSGITSWTDRRSRRLWVGRAGNMIEWPSPSSNNLTAPRSRGEQLHVLANGATGITYLPDVADSFTYSWPALTERDWQVLNGFYVRAFGQGPWCLVTPEGWNRLTRRQSMCGAVSGVVEGWSAATGTLAYDITDAAPVTPCGVMKWSGLSAASNLAPCTDAATLAPDTKTGIPYVPAEPFVFSAQLKASSGSPVVKLELVGVQADGSSPVTVAASNVTLTSSWQQLSVTAAPGDLGTSPYVVPVISYVSGGSALLAANPLAGYFDQAVEWGIGVGVPRVLWSSGAPRDLRSTMRAGMQVTLSGSSVG